MADSEADFNARLLLALAVILNFFSKVREEHFLKITHSSILFLQDQ